MMKVYISGQTLQDQNVSFEFLLPHGLLSVYGAVLKNCKNKKQHTHIHTCK